MATLHQPNDPDLEKENLLQLAKRSIDPEVLDLIKRVDESVLDESESEPKFYTTPMGACHAGEGLDPW